MIDVVRTIPATAAIEAPAIINCTDAQLSPRSAPVGLGFGNPLASILRYLPPSLEVGDSKAALAFDWRFLDRQTWRERKFHARECNANC